MTLTSEEKGALLLKNLDPVAVERVLAQLPPERRNRLRALMSRVPSGPESQPVFEDLVQELNKALTEAPPQKVSAVMPATLSPAAKAASGASVVQKPAAGAVVNAEVADDPEETPDPLAELAQLPAERIAAALGDENPRTVSLILNVLDVGLAADIYKRLAAPMRTDVSLQFSTQNVPGIEIVQRIAQAVKRKCESIVEAPKFPTGAARHRKMADMLRRLDKPDRLPILEVLEAQDAATAAAIKDLLYRFEDVLRIENRSMQKILTEVDTKTLAAALRGAPEAIAEKFLSNLSKRARDNLQEEMDLTQAPPKEEIAQAQKTIVQIIQRLDLAGELVMTE